MKKSYIILIIIILAAAGGWFYNQNLNQPEMTEYVTVQRTELIESLRASGVVKPHKTIEISSTIAENVKTINFEEGDHVKKENLLLKFDNDIAQAEYEQALAQVKSAEASLEQTEAQIQESKAQIDLAETKLENATELNDESIKEEIAQAELEIQNAVSELERRQYLYENDAIEKIKVEQQQHTVNVLESRKKVLEQRLVELEKTRNNRVKEAEEELKRAEVAYQAAQKQYQVAEGNLNSAKAALNRALVNLNKYDIKAPIDGVILKKMVDEGEYVQPGRTLFEIGTEELQIEISPDEKELNLLSIGKKGYVSPEAFPNSRYEVEIFEIAPSIDSDRGTIDVYLKPTEENETLIPNMSVSVEIISEREEDVLLIPRNYVLEDSNGKYLYLYNSETAQRQSIEVDKNYNGQVIVTEGVKEGDIVLDPNNITDGQTVVIEE
ncbi:MAG TPA: efflux RND transporter periplasmic adaptor subunit [Halanaerobiales bacterium]|nr:efflux RND transporter periplasmic adaptor subunit [Halanaerobiales bacterium]